jgi:hypothetical protein
VVGGRRGELQCKVLVVHCVSYAIYNTLCVVSGEL